MFNSLPVSSVSGYLERYQLKLGNKHNGALYAVVMILVVAALVGIVVLVADWLSGTDLPDWFNAWLID